ncbi:hypothetical protein SD960_15110 [Flavobacterium sp. MMLR14_040]|uniref:hypothetical protein n=1 Tax=Flavobacterium sp. MMLR14_040 TaxID=3093843 RepID=UPI00298F8BC1|nr:hypothetical protein [Flavobacterium sp. MMLR14_040]MDW8851433.1 hypothetical protein [Flavobacterium sp. MMLR14_040]
MGGTWVIKEITVNNKNFTPYLYINTFGIHCKDNSAWFHASYFFEDDKAATWTITNKNGTEEIEYVKIKSKIKIYNNNFKVKLEKTGKNNQLHLILKSNNVYISAYKILEDY